MGIILSSSTSNILCELSSSDWVAIIGALIGVFGVVVGTLLGWMLNGLSNSGKLNITPVEWTVELTNSDGLGGFTKSNYEESECLSLTSKVDIYNSSAKTKIMRNIEIAFYDKNGSSLYKLRPNDDDLTIKGQIFNYYPVQPLNFLPNTVTTKVFKWYAWKKELSYEFIFKTEKVYLTYLNEKGRTKKILLKRGKLYE